MLRRFALIAVLAACDSSYSVGLRTFDAASVIDVAVAIDADNTACLAVCNLGTCSGGVCTIQCSQFNGGNCPDPSPCPAGIPCRLVCTGDGCNSAVTCGPASECEIDCRADAVCGTSVRCGDATICEVTCGNDACRNGVECSPSNESCVVTCTGETGCGGDITCLAGRCDISCFGTGTCHAAVDCSTACACDVECPSGECGGAPTGVACPQAGCETANGCTSAGVCDTCP